MKNLTWHGRTLEHNGIHYFDYSATGFSFIFTGKKAVATILSDPTKHDENNKAVIGVFITPSDKTTLADLPTEPTYKYKLTSDENQCLLFESDAEQQVCITVMKFSEDAFGCAGLKALDVDGKISPIPAKDQLKLEFIGDSITCGYGIEGIWEKDIYTTEQQRPDKAYAVTAAKLLNAKVSLCSWSGIGLTSNYVDPATVNLPDTAWLMPANWPYTDKSLSLRFKLEPEVWDESRFSPDIVVVNLGTNDISWVRGIEDRRLNFRSAYRQLLEAIHRRSPNAKICCCLGVMGESLNETVQEAVDLFKKDFKKVVIETVFFKEQDPADGIGTDWHPSPKTHQKIAAQLVETLKKM